MSINKLFSKPLLALAIPSVVLVALYYVLAVPVLNQMNRQAVVEQAAESAQQLIDSHVEALLDQVELAANSYSVANTLIVTDVQQIDALNKHWQAFFSQSQRVAFLPYGNLGLTGLGQLGASLENNIERDLVSQAIKKKAPQVDFYSINNQQVLLFAAPVFEQPALTSDSKAVGALFMAVDSAWLQSMLSHIEENYDNGVSLRLLQSDSGKPLASFSNFTGEASVKQRLNRVSHLTVEAEKSASSILAPIFGVIIMGACALMMLVGLRLPASRETQVEAKVTEDAEQLSSYIGNLVAGTKKGKTLEPKLAFAANKEMLSSIKKALDRAKVDAKAQMALNDQFDLGGVSEPQAVASEPQAKTVEVSQPVSIPDVIFRAYDVRGHAENELSNAVVYAIASAFGSWLVASSAKSVVVGRDGRTSSDRIAEQVINALLAVGCDVLDIGLAPTPVTYFVAQQETGGNAIMVTASHNPAEDNGLKFLRGGQALLPEVIQDLYAAAKAGEFASAEGSLRSEDMADRYIDALLDDVVFASAIKVVVDCGNGAASEIAPILFASLGAEVVPLYADIDGSFPNRSPAARAQDLQALCLEVQAQQADLGIAFDGDADRMVAVTGAGRVVKGDHLLMLFAKDVLVRNPGVDVVFDVKCSKSLQMLIAELGGRPVMAKSGHSFVKRQMLESSALLGGEFTGHFMFKDRWFGFDDGLYAAARLIEHLSLEGKTLDQALDELSTLEGTDELELPVGEEGKQSLIKQFAATKSLAKYDKSLLDGVRVDLPAGWGLLRASNTGPKLTARFEAQTQEELTDVIQLFDSALKEVDPTLSIPSH